MNSYTSVLAIVLFSVFFNYSTEACSCSSRLHPQEAYCNSDFVILARVRKEYTKGAYTKIYKIRIRKEFKMNDTARIALKSNKLFTASSESMCGVNLQLGKLYLITGKIQKDKAYVHLCNYYQPWETITNRQKKGFKLLYSKGCSCKILHSSSNYSDHCHVTNYSCQSKYGICLRSPKGQCYWATSLDLRKCLKPFKNFKPRKTVDKNSVHFS